MGNLAAIALVTGLVLLAMVTLTFRPVTQTTDNIYKHMENLEVFYQSQYEILTEGG